VSNAKSNVMCLKGLSIGKLSVK